jgi:hypothetical protein
VCHATLPAFGFPNCGLYLSSRDCRSLGSSPGYINRHVSPVDPVRNYRFARELERTLQISARLDQRQAELRAPQRLWRYASLSKLLLSVWTVPCDRSIGVDDADRRVLINQFDGNGKIRSDGFALRRAAACGARPKMGADFATMGCPVVRPPPRCCPWNLVFVSHFKLLSSCRPGLAVIAIN